MMVVEAANIDDVVQQTKTSLQETKMETKKKIYIWGKNLFRIQQKPPFICKEHCQQYDHQDDDDQVTLS